MSKERKVKELQEELENRFVKTPESWWEDGKFEPMNKKTKILLGQIISITQGRNIVKATVLYEPYSKYKASECKIIVQIARKMLLSFKF